MACTFIQIGSIYLGEGDNVSSYKIIKSLRYYLTLGSVSSPLCV